MNLILCSHTAYNIFTAQDEKEGYENVKKEAVENASACTEKIRNFFRNHTLVTHGLCISGIIISSVLVYFMGTNLIGIPPNEAYNTSVNLASLFFVAYLTITFTILMKKRVKF